MFKRVSQCFSIVGICYFCPFNPFHYLPYLFTSHHHVSTAFSTHPYILYLHRCYILQYYWCSILLFSFPSFPKFHRVVPLLQICSTYEFVYCHACFYVYVCLLDLSSMYEKTCGLCLSEPGLLHVTWYPPIAYISLQTICHYSLWLSNTPLCIYTMFHDPFISCRASGLFP
jgi:hypothetical protein